MGGRGAGSNGNNANSASIEVGVEVEVEAELGKNWPFSGNFLCKIVQIIKLLTLYPF